MKIFLFEDIIPSVVEKILKKIHKSLLKNEEVWIIINSDGGDFESTLGLIDYIEVENNNSNLEAAKINTLCMGKAYSSAAFLLVSGHTRLITKNSIVMFHPVGYTLDDMPQPQVKKTADFYDKHSIRLGKYLTQKCHDKSGNLFKDCMESEIYLNADECLTLGVVDGYLGYK